MCFVVFCPAQRVRNTRNFSSFARETHLLAVLMLRETEEEEGKKSFHSRASRAARKTSEKNLFDDFSNN
jgi:hypothetical protein